MQPRQSTVGQSLALGLFMCLLILASFLAWRNVHLGRGDTRGATRLAAFVLFLSMLWWLCQASHVPTAHEFVGFLEALNVFFASAARAWIFYVALEPYVRRRWPQIMIAWSRLLGGGVRDPVVGGHLLIGTAFGIGFTILGLVQRLLVEQSGSLSTPGPGLDLDSVLDARHMTAVLAGSMLGSIFTPLILLLSLFLFRAILRRLWLAAAALILLIILLMAPSPASASLLDFFAGLVAVLTVIILIRFGVFALMAAFFACQTLLFFPLTADFSTWYAGSSQFAIAAVLALSAYALYTALAGRPLFKAGFLDSG
jgi:hypothetical protein